MTDRFHRSEAIVSVIAVLVTVVVMAIALTVTPPRLDAPPKPIWGVVDHCGNPVQSTGASDPNLTLLRPC